MCGSAPLSCCRVQLGTDAAWALEDFLDIVKAFVLAISEIQVGHVSRTNDRCLSLIKLMD